LHHKGKSNVEVIKKSGNLIFNNMNKKLKLWELDRISEEAFKLQKKFPIIVILNDIRSLNNIGSFFRTADAFNVEKIYLCGITANPPHRDIQKTALGATETFGLVFGNEVDGVDQEVVDMSDHVIEIPQFGTKHSLNVSVCAGVVMWEFAKRYI